jgi:AraC-like DNA-binding protein
VSARTQIENKVEVWRIDNGGHEIELLHAHFANQNFCRHTHDTYSIGFIEDGVNEFAYRGSIHRAYRGMVCMVNPGEVHSGDTKKGGWKYWNFYPPVDLLGRIADEMNDDGRRSSIPDFRNGVISDPTAADYLLQMFNACVDTQLTVEREVRIFEALVWLIHRHTDFHPAKIYSPSTERMSRAIEYIKANCSAQLSLSELAEVVGMSQYHFLRSFRNFVGMPPYAYLLQQRLGYAKAMLRKGVPLSEASVEAGFADQSHFTRHFRRVYGMSPGRWLIASAAL